MCLSNLEKQSLIIIETKEERRIYMAIYELLYDIKDQREADGICGFNGYLEDYLTTIENQSEDQRTMFFQSLLKKDEDLRICVDLKLNINRSAIANQIIRYKDAFKLPKGTICCPYIIYGTFGNEQKAIILTWGERASYIIAKALYFVISEPDNEYEGSRNEMIACYAQANQTEIAETAMDRFFWNNEKAGIVQRSLDAQIYSNYQEMYETALQLANYQIEHKDSLLAESEDSEETVNQMIAAWFLLKKFVYVQYMMDKKHLREHEDDVRKQRRYAKEKCDSIGFISYSELWKSAQDFKQN